MNRDPFVEIKGTLFLIPKIEVIGPLVRHFGSTRGPNPRIVFHTLSITVSGTKHDYSVSNEDAVEFRQKIVDSVRAYYE